jgi:hypothetical protein
MTYHWVRKYSNTTVPPVEKELLTLPEHLSSFLVFGEVRVVRSLVFCLFMVVCDLLFIYLLIYLLCFNATFSNNLAISWQPVLVVEEAGVPGENHRLWASNW